MRNTNTSVLYIVIFIAHVFMIGAWFQNSSHTYETKAYEPEPVTIPTATPTPSVAQSKPSTVEKMIVDTFGEDADMALAIARCESGLRPRAFNNNETWGGVSQDHGIFQINAYYHSDKYETVDQLYDPEFNIKTAKQIYDSSDWWAWSCFKNGAYKKFLK